MVAQTEEVWGRDESLSSGDKVTPATLQFQTGETEIKQRWGKELTVAENFTPVLQEPCDTTKAAILVAYSIPVVAPSVANQKSVTQSHIQSLPVSYTVSP